MWLPMSLVWKGESIPENMPEAKHASSEIASVSDYFISIDSEHPDTAGRAKDFETSRKSHDG
jgi:hypothetical protein